MEPSTLVLIIGIPIGLILILYGLIDTRRRRSTPDLITEFDQTNSDDATQVDGVITGAGAALVADESDVEVELTGDQTVEWAKVAPATPQGLVEVVADTTTWQEPDDTTAPDDAATDDEVASSSDQADDSDLADLGDGTAATASEFARTEVELQEGQSVGAEEIEAPETPEIGVQQDG